MMIKSSPPTPTQEQTPVDDVRRIRLRLSRQAGGDIHRQIEQARQVAQSYCQQLGLKTSALTNAARKSRRRAEKPRA